LEKNFMLGKLQSATVIFWILCGVVAFGFLGGCRSPEQYKVEADKEVYSIIDNKWQDDFGGKTNYVVSDANSIIGEVETTITEMSVSAPATDDELSEMVPESGVLSLQQAVEIATKYNRDYQSQKEALYLAALDLTLTRHRYARQWFGTIDGSYVDDKSNGDDMSVDGGVGVDQQMLLLEGILVNVGIALDWTRFLTGDPRTTLGSVLSGDIAIPLLGSGAGKVARENLTQAERNVLYRIRTFNRYRKTFVVSIISDYYRVLEQKNSVMIAEASYKRLIDSTNQLNMEVEVGQRAPSDADEAKQDLLQAENNLVTTRQSYEQLLDRFKIRLSLPTDANIVLDQNELAALEEIGISAPEYTEDEAMAIALNRRLDLANTQDSLEDSKRKLELAAEGLGVQLNITGSIDVDSANKTAFNRLQFQKGTYGLGFDADLPLDRKAERNAYREALITVEQRQRSLDNETENVKLDVRQAYRDLAETGETYRIQKLGLELAQRRVEEQELRLEYGQSTIRLLLEANDALVQAQNRVAGALVDHTVAKVSFFRDVGILQVKPDGMWEQGIQ
jgi:outer membrane protein TolC